MADRTTAPGFTREVLPRQVVDEARRQRAVEIARDTAPYGPADDSMLPIRPSAAQRALQQVLGVLLALAVVGIAAALCMLAEACG